ncbi:MAG: hypothetical protein SCARUB_05115, partial [Candidatus Scalindua rubra]
MASADYDIPMIYKIYRRFLRAFFRILFRLLGPVKIVG